MDWDDRFTGSLLSRRDAIKVLTASGVAFGAWPGLIAQTAGSAETVCVVRPEIEEGPYFVDRQSMRSDIRTEPSTGLRSAGATLNLAFSVASLAAGRCTPLGGAAVDYLAVRRARRVLGRQRSAF